MGHLDKRLPVYIVDDDLAACESLAVMLEDYEFNVSAFTDSVNFLDTLDFNRSGCVILDSRMPRLNGQQLQQCLLDQSSPLSVIFLTGYGDVPMAVEALQTGATHFFQKPVQAEALIPAIEDALLRSVVERQKQQLHAAFESLTARELDILKLLISGHRNLHIANELCIAVRTVEVHRASLMKKLDASTIAELAFRYGRINKNL